MPSGPAIHAFRYSKPALRQTLILSVVTGAVFLIGAALGQVLWAGVVMAGLCALVALRTAREMARTEPVLVIAPDGLTYLPFAPAVLPWSEVTEVAAVQREVQQVSWGRGRFVRRRPLEHVNIGVRGLERFPAGPGRRITRALQGLSGLPPVVIQLGVLDGATLETVTAAIRAHWPGAIAERTIRTR